MAKSYEPCYTRQSKSGTYTTCEGAQKKRKARAKLKKGGEKPPMVKKKGKGKPPPKKKKKVGVDETPEQNSQKAFLKLQKKKISQGFQGNNTGRINTGALNPGVQNLQVSPWQTQPEIEANVPQSLGQQNLQLLLGLGDLSDKITAEKKKLSYEERAKAVFQSHKAYFNGNDHYAQVEIGTLGTFNWDGYNLYEKTLFGKGSRVGTYENEERLAEWRDNGRASAFTKYDPLVLNVRSRGLRIRGFNNSNSAPAPKPSTYEDMAKSIFERRGESYAYAEISGIGKVLWDGYNLYESLYGRAGKKIGTYEDMSDLTYWRQFGDEDYNYREPLFIPRKSKKLKLL